MKSTVRDPVDALQVNNLVRDYDEKFSRMPIFSGKGSPEGAVAAKIGSIYLRTDGGASTTLYVKESGSGITKTGWIAK